MEAIVRFGRFAGSWLKVFENGMVCHDLGMAQMIGICKGRELQRSGCFLGSYMQGMGESADRKSQLGLRISLRSFSVRRR